MGEHYSSQPYDQDFYTKNINSIRHLLSNQQNSSNKWGTSLRSNLNTEKIKKDVLKNKKYFVENFLINKN
jgi:hypothetical protein